MLKPQLTIVKSVDRSAIIAAAIKALEENDVLVGVPAEKAPRQNVGKTHRANKKKGIASYTEFTAGGSKVNNAMLAYIHDRGMPTKNIPARPFMTPGIQNAQKNIESGFEKAGVAAMEGRLDDMLRGFHIVGLRAQISIQKKIQAGPFAPLSPRTLAARRRKGRTGTKPLIDTSQLLQHISYVVRKRK